MRLAEVAKYKLLLWNTLGQSTFLMLFCFITLPVNKLPNLYFCQVHTQLILSPQSQSKFNAYFPQGPHWNRWTIRLPFPLSSAGPSLPELRNDLNYPARFEIRASGISPARQPFCPLPDSASHHCIRIRQSHAQALLQNGTFRNYGLTVLFYCSRGEKISTMPRQWFGWPAARAKGAIAFR